MKKPRFSEEQIVGILWAAETRTIEVAVRRQGVFYTKLIFNQAWR
ncbi:MAG: hypothetical protein WD425_16645 [Nitrospirales bacterium]